MHALALDTEEIIKGASTKWNFMPFQPGFVGGHCISIDPHYLAFKAKRLGVQPEIICTARKINDGMTQYVLRSMMELLIKNKIETNKATIGVFGVTYKENSNDMRNSLALKLIKELQEFGWNCRVHDPRVAEVKNQQDSFALEHFDDIRDLSIVLLLVGHDYYRERGLVKLMDKCNNTKILMDIPHLFSNEHKAMGKLIYWSL